MSEMITRQEAMALGIARGRLDYYIGNGIIEKKKVVINKRPRILVSKEQVLRFVHEIPVGATVKTRKAPPAYVTKKANRLAFVALGVCAQLMKDKRIAAKFDGATVEDLLKAADAFEAKSK